MKLFLLLVMSIVATTLSAQVFVENFATATNGGNVEGYNGWYVSAKSSEAYGVSPKIEGESLFYTGYAGSDIGKVAVLDSLVGKTSATQRISTKLVKIGNDTLVSKDGQKMYAAFMVSILPNSYTSYRDFFTWEGSTTSSFTRGRVFVKTIAGTNDIQFAVTKNSSSAADFAESPVISGGVGSYHLLVLVYEAIAGEVNNDVVSLYVNPVMSKTEAEQVKLTSKDVQTDYKTEKIKINLRQRGIGAKVGGIRVGTSWNVVVKGTNTNVAELSKIDTEIYSYGKTIVTKSKGMVEVYDLSGKKILNTVSNGKLETSLKNGLYLVRFKDQEGNVASGKISIN